MAHSCLDFKFYEEIQFEKKNSGRGTMDSKVGLLCQLVPSLEMTYVLRELFNIPRGLKRILNIDESMTYRYDQEEKVVCTD